MSQSEILWAADAHAPLLRIYLHFPCYSPALDSNSISGGKKERKEERLVGERRGPLGSVEFVSPPKRREIFNWFFQSRFSDRKRICHVSVFCNDELRSWNITIRSMEFPRPPPIESSRRSRRTSSSSSLLRFFFLFKWVNKRIELGRKREREKLTKQRLTNKQPSETKCRWKMARAMCIIKKPRSRIYRSVHFLILIRNWWSWRTNGGFFLFFEVDWNDLIGCDQIAK